MQRWRRRQQGFTLIEAVVVVGLIGIIVTATIPSMRRARMRAAMLDTVRTFEQAAAVSRINAIKRGMSVCMIVIPGGVPQELSGFQSWYDVNGNEVQDSGEENVGSWQIRNTDEWTFNTSSDFPMYVLNASGGGINRGIVYLPTGMAITAAAGQPGIGQGAFEYYIYQDGRKWNTFRIGIFGGAGTVQIQMQIPGTSNWDDNFAHWEYY